MDQSGSAVETNPVSVVLDPSGLDSRPCTEPLGVDRGWHHKAAVVVHRQRAALHIQRRQTEDWGAGTDRTGRQRVIACQQHRRVEARDSAPTDQSRRALVPARVTACRAHARPWPASSRRARAPAREQAHQALEARSLARLRQTRAFARPKACQATAGRHSSPTPPAPGPGRAEQLRASARRRSRSVQPARGAAPGLVRRELPLPRTKCPPSAHAPGRQQAHQTPERPRTDSAP